jgi:hypothetical protein
MTGVAEKMKIKTKAERSRSRSRSNSSERRRRNMNMPVGASYPVNNSAQYPVNNSAQYPINHGMQPMNNSYPVNYPDQAYYPATNQAPIYNNVATTAPIYDNGLGQHNINPMEGAVAHNKGKFVERGNVTKATEKINYVNPVTGLEENATIKTKVRGDRSRSRSTGKSKTTYDYKTKETAEGQKTVIAEKHREGGVMQNIKNKINNIIHR